MAMGAGFYWIRAKRSNAEWTVARFDGDDSLGWTFFNNLHLADTDELFGDGEDGMGYELGPRISEPT